MTFSIPDKAKVNANRHVETLLPRLKCKSLLLPSGFIFCRTVGCSDGKVGSRERITTNCREFTGKDERSPNSPDVNPLDYHAWGVVLKHCKTFHPETKSINGQKKVLQIIWNLQLLHDSINKAILSFTKRLRACVKAGVNISNVLWMCFEISCLTSLNTEHHKWRPFFGVILKYRTEYCKSCNFWSNGDILVTFSRACEKPFFRTSWNFDKTIGYQEISFFSGGTFLATCYNRVR